MKLIFSSARSAVLEIENNSCYFSPCEYGIYLNGEAVKRCNTNVFSLYSLTPDTEYTVSVNGDTLTFTTKSERAFIDIARHGAVADGFYDNTEVIQTAISTAPEGSTLYFGEGLYRTSSLFVKSNVTLYLDKGAVILGVTDRKKYPVLPSHIGGDIYLTTWEGEEAVCFASLINVSGSSNVTVTGEGTIDADAQHGDWWQNPKEKRIAWRPRTVQIVNSENVTLEGITVQNSYSWTVHPLFSENVNILNVNIKNPASSPNTDGIDPESCNGVNIIGTQMHVGDDCIAVKACKFDLAMKLQRPCENVVIRNCHLDAGHGGVVIGSEMSGGVKNLTAEKCLMTNTDRGLRIKTRRGRGKLAVISGLTFRNVVMRGVKNPFVMNMFYFCDADGHSDYVQSREALPVDDGTPSLGSFIFEDIQATEAENSGCYFDGLPESPIESITLKNVDISFAKGYVKPDIASMSDDCKPSVKMALLAQNVRALTLDNVTFKGYEGEKYTLHNVGTFEE